MSRLELRGVSKSFGGTAVLRNVSLQVAERQLVALLGSSGAGKSTLLRLVAGFERPDAGEIWLDGVQLASATGSVAPEKRGIGLVPQEAALFGHLTVAENIGFGLRGVKPGDRASRVAELLRLIEIPELADRRPDQLSGGQQQRVALARALAPRPKFLLLDEPFSALDVELRERLRQDVRRVLKAEGATALLVTHDQEEALSLADRVAILRDGEIAQYGAPAEIYNAPVDVGVATFLGDSVVIDGEVVEGKVVTGLGRLTPLNQVQDGARGKVAIRPENFYLQPNPNGDSVVAARTFFGHDAILEVDTPQLRVRARSNGPFAPEVGMRVTVWVRGSVNFYPDAD